MRRGVLFGLFFLSGVSALDYELLWQRELHLVFGVSTPAVSAVLAAFMGGLALGGLAFGRLADRTARPLRWYAGLEAAIGLSALLVPVGFALLAAVHDWLFHTFEPGPTLGTLLRFVLAMLVLLGPATLIGGTVPFMGRLAFRGRRSSGDGFSLLYGVNTLGAVVGAALTGLVLLRYCGMRETLGLAVGVNLLVALLALRLREDGVKNEVAERVAAAGPGIVPLAVAAATGAATTGLEVAWTRVLGVFTSNSAFAFALVLSVVLLGLAVGGLLQAIWARRSGDRWLRLALCQGLLAVVTLATLPYYHTSPAWLARCCDGTPGLMFLGELALTAGALFLPAVLMGLSFPLLVAEVADRLGGRSRWLGRIYAVNTLGCVAGAVVTGFWLIPQLGIHGTFGIVTALVLAATVAAGLSARRPTPVWRMVGACGVVVAAVVAWQLLPAGPYLKAPILAPRQLLYYAEGDNGTVTVVEEPNGVRNIMVDGQPVAGTAASSVTDQKMLAHLPLLLHPNPHRALTVGFGSGGTSHSMTLHGVGVDCVEIERAVPAAAAHFVSENAGVRTDPHFRLVVDDARSWLRVAPLPYDAIVTDCTNLQYKSSGDLYTVEYFELMRRKLTADGVAAAWIPANGIDAADLKTLIRSFHRVFPHTSVWHMNGVPTDFLILVGTPQTLSVDLEALGRRMADPAVHADLECVGLADPQRLLCTLLTTEAGLTRYLADGPLHTDDRPLLSYTTYGASFRSTIAANLLQLLACRTDPADYVRGPADRGQLLRNYAASNEVMLGHVALLCHDPAEALRHYVEASKLLPGDELLHQQITMLYLRMYPPPGQTEACAEPPVEKVEKRPLTGW